MEALRMFNVAVATMREFMGGPDGYMTGDHAAGVLLFRPFFLANSYDLEKLAPAAHVMIWQGTVEDMNPQAKRRQGKAE